MYFRVLDVVGFQRSALAWFHDDDRARGSVVGAGNVLGDVRPDPRLLLLKEDLLDVESICRGNSLSTASRLQGIFRNLMGSVTVYGYRSFLSLRLYENLLKVLKRNFFQLFLK